MEEFFEREDIVEVAKESGKVRRGTRNFLVRSVEGAREERELNLIMAVPKMGVDCTEQIKEMDMLNYVHN